MIKNVLYIILVISNIGFGQLNFSFNVEDAKRNDGKLYLWVYFSDKGKEPSKILVTEKTVARRNKVDPQKFFSWYDKSPSNSYIEDVLSTGAKLRGESRWLNAISVECDKDQLAEIATLPFVENIKPIVQYRRTVPSGSSVERTLDKHSTSHYIDYGNSFEQLQQINVPTAHDSGYYGKDVSILVLDTGFNLEHPAFDSLNVVAEWDVINNDSTTANEDGQDVSNQHNHGTSVLSILAGYTPSTLIGPAFRSDILLAKTEILNNEIQLEEDNYVRALEWGEAYGVDIATSSLGYTDWYDFSDLDGETAVTTKAVDIAVSLGMVCVTSVGNENGNSWGHIVAPADADSVISVGAVDSTGIIANFSSRGPSSDGRVKPEVCAMGVDVFHASGNGATYSTGNGTSYAAPLVAGAAAIILSANPDWTPIQVRNALMETASMSDSPNNDYGYGIIDVLQAINDSPSVDIISEITIPENFYLYQNFPNPFNSETTIIYDLKEETSVELTIYNILGEKIITLVNETESGGVKSISWNGSDTFGRQVSSGIYFYNLKLGETSISKKMVFVK